MSVIQHRGRWRQRTCSCGHSLAKQARQAAAAAAAATTAIPGRSVWGALLRRVQLLLRGHCHGKGAVAASSSVGGCRCALLRVPSHAARHTQMRLSAATGATSYKLLFVNVPVNSK